MNEDQFWAAVEDSRGGWDVSNADGNMSRQQNALRQLLSALATGDVQDFQRHFNHAFTRAYRWDLWQAAELIASGCSDDWFEYFRYWLISMGRSVYERALVDPDSLDVVASRADVEDVFFEEFGTIALDVLAERGTHVDVNADRPEQPDGVQWAESELGSRLPRLWARFGTHS